MNKKGGFFIVFLIGLIIALGILFIAYLNSIEKKELINETENITINYYDIYLSSNSKYKINYNLYNTTEKCEEREITNNYTDSITLEQTIIKNNETFCFQAEHNLLLRGIILENMIEEYGGVQENTSIIIQGYSDFYYFNKTICNITENKSHCRINMKEKALDYSMELNETTFKIITSNKTIQKPLICWNWGNNVWNVRMNLKSVEVPEEYRYKQTSCYQSKDINSDIEMNITIVKNPYYTAPQPVYATIYDYEEQGYLKIGKKEISLII